MKHVISGRKRERTYTPPPTTVRVVSAPRPVCEHIELPGASGIFHRFMAPCAGRISDVTIRVDSLKDDESIVIEAGPADCETLATMYRFTIHSGLNEIAGDIDIAKGEQIVMRVISGTASGIWLSYNWSVADEVSRA